MHKRYHKRGRKRIGAGIKNVFEETDMQVQEAQRIPKKINPNRPTPTYYNKNGKVSLVLSWYRICLQCRKAQFDSWVGKICWRRDRLLTPVSLGLLCSLVGKESACNAGDLGWEDPLEKGKATHPLQYSRLENYMDCIVHGVAKSQIQLSNFHFPFPWWSAG